MEFMKLRRSLNLPPTYPRAVLMTALLAGSIGSIGCSTNSKSHEELAAEGASAAGGQSGDEGHKTQQPASTPAVGGNDGERTVNEVDPATFEFRGQAIGEFIAAFGGERNGQWMPVVDSAYPSTFSPTPGEDGVELAVAGAPTSVREVARGGIAQFYVVTVPLRLHAPRGGLDLVFTGELQLQATGEVWMRHTFTSTELGGTIQLELPADWPLDVDFILDARLWPGGSAGTLTVTRHETLNLEPAIAAGAPHLLAVPPGTPPPPQPPPPPPAGGAPSQWTAYNVPGVILVWPDGEACGYAQGRDYALDGLTPGAVLDAVSQLKGQALSRVEPAPEQTWPGDGGYNVDAGMVDLGGDAGLITSNFSIEVSTPKDDVCATTTQWRGSEWASLGVTVDMRVVDSESGLDMTLPVQVVALHDGAEVKQIYFASALEPSTWAVDGVPVVTGSNLEEFAGLSDRSDVDMVVPMVTGRIDNNGQAIGQVLLVVPAREGDARVAVTDLNLGDTVSSEVQTLLSGVDWLGAKEVLFDAVWSTAPLEETP